MARKSRAKEKRQEIVKAFRQCILDMGMDRASMAEVAERVGLDRSTLHYYYPKRAQLVDDLIGGLTSAYVRKLEDTLSTIDDSCPAMAVVDYLFSDQWHDADNSRLIDEISTVFGRQRNVEDPIAKVYRTLEKMVVDIFLQSFPNAATSEVRAAAYTVFGLAEGSISMMEYNFPKNRRTAAHKWARRMVESLAR